MSEAPHISYLQVAYELWFQMFDVTLLLNLSTAESYSRFYKGQTL